MSSVPEASSFTMADVHTSPVSQITAASDIETENAPDSKVTKYSLAQRIYPVYTPL